MDRAVGTWRYLALESSYESGPGPLVSQRRWIRSSADLAAVTFVHDFTSQDGQASHLEFTARYDGRQYPLHGSTLYNTVSLHWISEHEVRQIFKLDGKTTVEATRTVSPDGNRLTIDTVGTISSTSKDFRNLIIYERVTDPATAFTATLMVDALAEQGVEVCFTNPGTSEMHFVIALDDAAKADKMRSVLCLFEGVATGAADGYARMAGKPAVSLLHLGHGLANGLSNLHNAKWARVPLINIVGDHARPLQQYNSHPGASHSSPYLGDIEGYAGPVSGWVRRCRTSELAVADALDCLRASFGPEGQPQQVSTLIVPADIAWAPPSIGQHRVYSSRIAPTPPNSAAIDGATAVLASGDSCLLLIGGNALLLPGLVSAAKVAARTRCGLVTGSKTNAARHRRGAGAPIVPALPYYFDDVSIRRSHTESTAAVVQTRCITIVAVSSIKWLTMDTGNCIRYNETWQNISLSTFCCVVG